MSLPTTYVGRLAEDQPDGVDVRHHDFSPSSRGAVIRERVRSYLRDSGLDPEVEERNLTGSITTIHGRFVSPSVPLIEIDVLVCLDINLIVISWV